MILLAVALLSILIVLSLVWLFYPLLSSSLSADVKFEDLDLSPSCNARETPLLSIVIPAFDEEARIQRMLQDAHGFLHSSRGQQSLKVMEKYSKMYFNASSIELEWLIVDDGSRDKTKEVVKATLLDLKSKDQWRILSLKENSGKGAAVKTGMIHSIGLFRLMVDADGATDFGPAFENLMKALATNSLSNNNVTMAPFWALFGSRAHLQHQVSTQRSFVRSFLMHAFHFFVSMLVSTRIKDTQCGFKLFTKTSAKIVFHSLHLKRWAFDIELVAISEAAGISLVEVDVPWTEVDGSKLATSKLALALASLGMLRDMICVRLCYLMGLWKVRRDHDNIKGMPNNEKKYGKM